MNTKSRNTLVDNEVDSGIKPSLFLSNCTFGNLLVRRMGFHFENGDAVIAYSTDVLDHCPKLHPYVSAATLCRQAPQFASPETIYDRLAVCVHPNRRQSHLEQLEYCIEFAC